MTWIDRFSKIEGGVERDGGSGRHGRDGLEGRDGLDGSDGLGKANFFVLYLRLSRSVSFVVDLNIVV